MDPLSVGQVARRLGVRPSQITQLFYEQRLRDDLCPIVAGRRLIPPDYVSVIAMELRRKGIQIPRDGSASPDKSQGQKQEDSES